MCRNANGVEKQLPLIARDGNVKGGAVGLCVKDVFRVKFSRWRFLFWLARRRDGVVPYFNAFATILHASFNVAVVGRSVARRIPRIGICTLIVTTGGRRHHSKGYNTSLCWVFCSFRFPIFSVEAKTQGFLG